MADVLKYRKQNHNRLINVPVTAEIGLLRNVLVLSLEKKIIEQLIFCCLFHIEIVVHEQISSTVLVNIEHFSKVLILLPVLQVEYLQ